VEAMACGVLVIAPKEATFPEVVAHETLLYKPEDPSNLAEKVITILNNADLYNSIKEHLLARVREYFDIRKTAKKYMELYSALKSA
jgi:glycosyltransferase involved in cell wall biosynthesis